MDGARKRRKWDVAAPGGMPLTGNRAGIGAGGTGPADLNGFITAQGHQVPQITPASASFHPLPAAAATTQPGTGNKTNQSLDQATIARAQQGAQAIVERINAVRQDCILPSLTVMPVSDLQLPCTHRSSEQRASFQLCVVKEDSMTTAKRLLVRWLSTMRPHPSGTT